ncbi:MAG: hypothetical protein HZA62_15670 [Rhodocyclales bacterium]|nr:hypothetical protein [Rhodocyclales bacterium]
MTGLRHAIRYPRPRESGFVLIALLAMLAIGGLYFFISNLSPEFLRERAQQTTGDALAQAREALVGYAVRFRDDQLNTGTSGLVYGYLPMPDLGTSRNNNTSCTDEGCEAANFAGNVSNTTVIGRFPWRALGTGPLRDASGECLWYAVSGSHQRIQRATPMNWDTLGHIDIVVAKGTAAMVSAISSAHDRPIAVIFSPGPSLAGQNRQASSTDSVTECGGNYIVSNYLDPATSTALAGVTNYFAGSTNSASGDASATPKSLVIGSATLRNDGMLWAGTCPAGSSDGCSVVANDAGTVLTSEQLFRILRGSSYFRADINSMLERMSECLRDQIAAGSSFAPTALTGFTSPTDKSVGRIPSSACYDDTKNPLGYFSHYADQLFLIKPTTGSLSVTLDSGAAQSCAAGLIFAGQRGTKNPVPTDGGESVTQLRTSDQVSASNSILNTNWPANYLEGNNLSAFTTTGALNLSGHSQFLQVSSSQVATQDIVRCIPTGASLTVVAPTVSANAGDINLARYAPGTGVLTLGSSDINSNYGASASDLYACAWTPETHTAGTGLRSYFRFRIKKVGEGFTFAVVDGDRNAADACGASRQHLGYSGDNGNALIPEIAWPKLAIEFDTVRNCNSPYFDGSGVPSCVFTESGSSLSNGRNDPCYTSSCWSGSILYPGGSNQGLDNSSHVAIVYWGHGAANAGAGVTLPLLDDNYHGLPTPPDSSARPAPRNPAPVLPYPSPAPSPPGGVAPLDRMGSTTVAFREFHARLEVTRSFTAPTDAKDGVTTVLLKFFIEAQPAANISAITYNSGSPPTLSVTTASAHSLATGDTVVIKDAVPSGYNGEFTVTVTDTTHFTATLPSGTANPGKFISAITWADVSGSTDRATVTSASHGLSTGNSVTISGAFPPEYNGTRTITKIDDNSYRFGLELDYEPGDMTTAVATPKALTARATALANTTRPMSELDATATAFVQDTALIYDEQMSACAGSAPLCPTGQSCGSDNMCYKPSFRNLRLGYTVSERPTTNTTTARGQLVEISDRATTWLP